jgi:hypothetical protein
MRRPLVILRNRRRSTGSTSVNASRYRSSRTDPSTKPWLLTPRILPDGGEMTGIDYLSPEGQEVDI